MDKDISELESIIDSAFEWKTKQLQLLSEQAIHTHHSKSMFFYETFSQYSKANEKIKFIERDKKHEDTLSFKAFFIVSIITLGAKLILNYIFDYKEKDEAIENILIFNFLYLILSSWVREIIHTTKISSNESLISILERDMFACGLSWLFVQKLIKHNEIFNDDKQDEYEALSEKEKHRINLKSHLKDFCISAAIISTFCNDNRLIEPPRDIGYGGASF